MEVITAQDAFTQHLWNSRGVGLFKVDDKRDIRILSQELNGYILDALQIQSLLGNHFMVKEEPVVVNTQQQRHLVVEFIDKVGLQFTLDILGPPLSSV